MTKPIVSFRSFANTPKKQSSVRRNVGQKLGVALPSRSKYPEIYYVSDSRPVIQCRLPNGTPRNVYPNEAGNFFPHQFVTIHGGGRSIVSFVTPRALFCRRCDRSWHCKC